MYILKIVVAVALINGGHKTIRYYVPFDTRGTCEDAKSLLPEDTRAACFPTGTTRI